MPRVLVAGKIHVSGLGLLRDAPGVSLDYVEDTGDAALRAHLPRAEAVILRTQTLDAGAIASAPDLRVVSRHGVGYDAVDVAALSDRGIPLTVVGDVNSGSVAEHTMMLILACARRLTRADRAVRTGNWAYRDQLDSHDLADAGLLVIGMGRIGRRVAALGDAFGMSVTGFDPNVAADAVDGVPLASDLSAALPRADFVTLHVPRTDGPVLGEAELALLPRGAVVVSAARGGVVDEDALEAALGSGQVAAAGLDVFAEEPPSSDHPLFRHDAVICTPHSAGLTEECAGRMARAAAQNVLDCFAGRLDPALVVNAASVLRPSGGDD